MKILFIGFVKFETKQDQFYVSRSTADWDCSPSHFVKKKRLFLTSFLGQDFSLPDQVKCYKTFCHLKKNRWKNCNDDVNLASFLLWIIGEKQSKCENNLGYYLNSIETLSNQADLIGSTPQAVGFPYTDRNQLLAGQIKICRNVQIRQYAYTILMK